MTLLLLLALAASPAPVEAYAQTHCPQPKVTSQAGLHARATAQVGCLRKQMDAELDRLIVPLRRTDPARFRAWMRIQATYNTWVQDVCDAQEALRWVDVKTGLVSNGSAEGETRDSCTARLYAARAWFAAELADGRGAAMVQRWIGIQREGEQAWDALQIAIDEVQKASGRRVAADAGGGVMRPYAQTEWARLLELLERSKKLGDQLGRQQCAVLAHAPKDCSSFYPNALFSQVRIDVNNPAME